VVALITRTVKGSSLTHAELDGNFDNIKAAIEGQVLDNLADVNASTPTDGQALIYDQATDTWIPGSVASGGIKVPTAYISGTYTVGDSVVYNAATYVCIAASTTALPTVITDWQILGGAPPQLKTINGNSLVGAGNITLLDVAMIHAITLGMY
jgi:hypothetical protein